MSTTVVLNLPEHGHMNATYPVVAELVRRGERVVYYATEPYRAQVEETGAEFAAYGDAERFRPPAHQGGLYSVMAYLMGLAEEVLPALLDRLQEERPDYLLVDSMCVWGKLVQQLLKLPAITLASVFVPHDGLVSMDEMLHKAYGQAPKEVLLSGIDALNSYIEISQRVDARFGTRSPDIVEFFASRQPLNIVFTSQYFHLLGDQFDDSYRFVGPSIAPRTEDAGDLDLQSLGSGPLIYISMGTIFNEQPRFYRNCIEALGGSPYRVVMSIGAGVDRAALGDIPANFMVRESAPQLKVLEQASLFLTHGGMNSTSEALWHEVPLLVFPQHGDQHIVAARVAELGAGVRLLPADVEPARLRELVDHVANDGECRQNAHKIAESFQAAGGYRRAADEILAFTRAETTEAAAEQEKRYVDSLHAGASSTWAHQPNPARSGRVGTTR
jgi:MGT family glycosyltransferase